MSYILLILACIYSCQRALLMIPLTFNLKLKQLYFKKRMKKTLLKNNEEEKKGIRNRLQKKRKKKQGKTQTITKLFTDFC